MTAALTHAVSMPCGTSAGSGGGARLVMMSEFTSVLRSDPINTTRHGVMIVPVSAAGCSRRITSSAG